MNALRVRLNISKRTKEQTPLAGVFLSESGVGVGDGAVYSTCAGPWLLDRYRKGLKIRSEKKLS